MQPIDITGLDTKRGAEQGCALQLRHPATRQELGITLRILGADSDVYQQKIQELTRRGIELMRAEKRTDGLTFAEKRDQEAELYAAITLGWEPAIKFGDGEPEAFSEAAALRLYRQYPWIRRQIDAALENIANFLPASGSSS